MLDAVPVTQPGAVQQPQGYLQGKALGTRR
ncbi:hypothetical protein J3B00_004618 [Pseudomonas sp. BP8]|nr:hypothetical protein [Pseudomonas sp. BP8]